MSEDAYQHKPCGTADLKRRASNGSPDPIQPLELRTYVDKSTHVGEPRRAGPTPVRFSNACTQVQRLGLPNAVPPNSRPRGAHGQAVPAPARSSGEEDERSIWSCGGSFCHQ